MQPFGFPRSVPSHKSPIAASSSMGTRASSDGTRASSGGTRAQQRLTIATAVETKTWRDRLAAERDKERNKLRQTETGNETEYETEAETVRDRSRKRERERETRWASVEAVAHPLGRPNMLAFWNGRRRI